MSVLGRVQAEPSKITQANWWEYPLRFLFGGVITAAVGIVAKTYGPGVAGLFLAFPAILPAALTLISRHDGERPAGVDAVGAALGSVGLAGFAIVVWALSPRLAAWAVLLLATAVWAVLSLVAWLLFNKVRHPGLHVT